MSVEPHHTKKRLTTILMEAGVITAEQIGEVLRRQRESGARTGEILVEMGIVSEEDIGWALSRQLDLTFVDPHFDALDVPLIEQFPEELLRRIQAVPLVSPENQLEVALADPLDEEAVDELEQRSGRPLGISVATPKTIDAILDRVFGAAQSGGRAQAAPLRLVTPTPDLAWERSGTQFLRFHLLEARKWQATEIHFIPTAGELEVFYRIGSDLNAVAREQLLVLEFLRMRLDALGMPATDKVATHGTGRIVHEVDGREIEIEVSVVQSALGPAFTLQPRWRGEQPVTVEDLGFSAAQRTGVAAMLAQPAGCVLVSGPRRCGGSTALAVLAASAGLLDKRAVVFRRVGSMPIPGVMNLEFECGAPVESWQEIAVAQCADVVILDDVLRAEQVRQVLSPAASGRLLLVRTDWLETADLLSYLLGACPSRALLSRRLLGILQSRLVRYPDADRAVERRGLPLWQRGVFEVLALDEGCRRAIREGEDPSRILAGATRRGFTTLADECRRLVETDRISAVEAARVLT